MAATETRFFQSEAFDGDADPARQLGGAGRRKPAEADPGAVSVQKPARQRGIVPWIPGAACCGKCALPLTFAAGVHSLLHH